MKVLTYTHGILTIINENNFFKEPSIKPSFITGEHFYYEPTLQQMDGVMLNDTQIEAAEAFIQSFDFNAVTEIADISVFCVDAHGNFLGKKVREEGEFEVPTPRPIDALYIVWDFEKQEWYESILVDKYTGKYVGKWINTAFEDSVYVRASSYDNELCSASQTYDFSSKSFTVDIAFVKNSKLSNLSTSLKKEIDSVVGFVGYGEMSSWDKQEVEARAWVTDNTYQTPFIDALLVGRNMGETKADLVAKIIAKADAYKAFYGQLLGKLHAKQKEVENASTLEALKAIVW